MADDLKDLVESAKKDKKTRLGESIQPLDKSLYDVEDVDRIVSKIQRKYAKEGLIKQKVGGSLGTLRGVITSDESDQDLQLEDPLAFEKFKSPIVKELGSLYLNSRESLEKLTQFISRLPGAQDLEFDLYSANLSMTPAQFVGLVAVGVVLSTAFTTLLSFIIAAALFATSKNPSPVLSVLPLAVGALTFLAASVIGIRLPKTIANNRAKAIERELPFALRHMATQIKSGMALHKTLQTVAYADYGVFSEEIQKTLKEMDEGLSTEAALENLKARTQSKPLRRAVLHILRALRTGGQLSAVIANLAEQVADELLIKISEFAEKMNFIGVLYIIGGIVGPVLIMVLGGIVNAPIGGQASFFSAVPLTPFVLSIIFMFVMPMFLAFIIMFVKAIEPIGG